MTPADLDKLQALHEAATPGEWHDVGWGCVTNGDETAIVVHAFNWDDDEEGMRKQRDADLIVAMRNAIGELLAMARGSERYLDYEAIAIQNRDEWMHRADEAEARIAKLEAAMKEIAMQEAWTKSRDIARAALVKP